MALSVLTRQVTSNVKHAMKISLAQLIARVIGQSGINALMSAVQMEHSPVIGSSLWRQNMVVRSAVIWTRCSSALATQSQSHAQLMLFAHGQNTVSAQQSATTQSNPCQSSRLVNGWRFLQLCMVEKNAKMNLQLTSCQKRCATSPIAQLIVKVDGVRTPHVMQQFLPDVMASISVVVALRPRPSPSQSQPNMGESSAHMRMATRLRACVATLLAQSIAKGAGHHGQSAVLSVAQAANLENT